MTTIKPEDNNVLRSERWIVPRTTRRSTELDDCVLHSRSTFLQAVCAIVKVNTLFTAPAADSIIHPTGWPWGCNFYAAIARALGDSPRLTWCGTISLDWQRPPRPFFLEYSRVGSTCNLATRGSFGCFIFCSVQDNLLNELLAKLTTHCSFNGTCFQITFSYLISAKFSMRL